LENAVWKQAKENISYVYKPLISFQSQPSHLKPKCKGTTIAVSFAMWALCKFRDLVKP
jgi:hypothetical protein